MTQSQATMSVRHLNEGASIIHIEGEVSAAAENTLMDAYAAANDHNARAIILDLTKMDYMNSSGIGLLVTLLIRVNRQAQKLLTYGLSDHYKQIFALTRLNEAIGVYSSEGEALTAAGVRPR